MLVTNRVVVLDEGIDAEFLIVSWINGNKRYVIDKLKNDHPALTALVITEGAKSKRLTLSDVNSIVNMLIDDRVELANNPH
jgi:hypothetical protein